MAEEEEELEVWLSDVEQELQALATVQVQEGLGADDPFHISQLHIALDRTDGYWMILRLGSEMGRTTPNHPSAHFLSC